MTVENNKKESGSKSKIILSFSLFGELLYSIAIPVVAFTLLGKYLDKVWNHNFLFVLVGGVLGIVLGVSAVYAKAEKIRQRIYNNIKKEEEDKKD